MSMKINCPKCGFEIDMNDHGDTWYDSTGIEIDCDNCDVTLEVEPSVKITFHVEVVK